MFKTEDGADFFINQHIEVRGKPLPLVRKAKWVLKVVLKWVHAERSSNLLLSELYDYIEHASSVRNSDRQYNGTNFYDGTKQIFVTHLMRYIPRSLKIGHRWCLIFYKDQPVPPRRPLRVSTIVETSPLEELHSQMELEVPGKGASVWEISNMNSDQSEASSKTVTNEPMPEISLTSKRMTKPEEGSKEEEENKTEQKKKRNNRVDTTEFNSCVEHLRVIVEELEPSDPRQMLSEP